MSTFIKKIFGHNPFGVALSKETGEDWLKSIDTSTPVASLKQINAKLSEIIYSNDSFDHHTLFSWLIDLDAGSREIIKNLNEQYVFTHNLKSDLKEAIWLTITAYFTYMASGYSKVLDQGMSLFNAESITLMRCNLMDMREQTIKWRAFKHNASPETLWLKNNQIFQDALADHANAGSLADKEAFLSTALKSKFAKSAMLGSLNLSSWEPVHIEFADRLLDRLVDKVPQGETEEGMKSPFICVLNEDRPARRWRKQPYQGKAWFIEAEGLALFLRHKTSDEILKKLHSGFSASHMSKFVEFASKEWKADGYVRQRRMFDRKEVNVLAKASIGIGQIAELIRAKFEANEFSKAGAVAEYNQKSSSLSDVWEQHHHLSLSIPARWSEEWAIVDESKGGLGVQAPTHSAVHIGSLVGITLSNKAFCLTEVKSITHDFANSSKVGLEKIQVTAEAAIFEKLYYEQNMSLLDSHDKGVNDFYGLIMDKGSKTSIIIPRNEYIFDLVIKDNSSRVGETWKLGAIVRSGDNWVMVEATSIDV